MVAYEGSIGHFGRVTLAVFGNSEGCGFNTVKYRCHYRNKLLLRHSAIEEHSRATVPDVCIMAHARCGHSPGLNVTGAAHTALTGS